MIGVVIKVWQSGKTQKGTRKQSHSKGFRGGVLCNYWVGIKWKRQKKYLIFLTLCAIGYLFIAFVANNQSLLN